MLEIKVHDDEPCPMVESADLHLLPSPAMANEVGWAGFRLASFANNHPMDWGDGIGAVRPQRDPAGLGSGTRRNSATPAMSSSTDSTFPDPPIRNVTGTGGSTGVSNLARNDSK